MMAAQRNGHYVWQQYFFSFFCLFNTESQMTLGQSSRNFTTCLGCECWPRFTNVHQKFKDSSLKSLADQKRQNICTMSDNFVNWLQMSLKWNMVSSVGKWHCTLRSLLHMHT